MAGFKSESDIYLICMWPAHYLFTTSIRASFLHCAFVSVTALVSPQANPSENEQKNKRPWRASLQRGKDPMMREQKTLILPTKRKRHLKENIKSPT